MVRAGMHITALANGDKELAAKIDEANLIVKQLRLMLLKQQLLRVRINSF